jgi:hypothetical protein
MVGSFVPNFKYQIPIILYKKGFNIKKNSTIRQKMLQQTAKVVKILWALKLDMIGITN